MERKNVTDVGIVSWLPKQHETLNYKKNLNRLKMNTIKTITRYALYILLCAVFLCSCTGVETPNFNDKPFVVGSVERYNDSLCIYTATKFTVEVSELFASKQRFIAREKLFQVGDTVRISK